MSIFNPSISASALKVAARNGSAQTISSAGTNTITNWTTEIDTNSSFDATTGTFTAPFAGIFMITYNITTSAAVGVQSSNTYVYKNGSTEIAYALTYLVPAGGGTASLTRMLDLSSGDTINIAIQPSTTTVLASDAFANTISIVQLM